MNADEMIESYVRDVASCLPRSKRDDVAFELRALLADDLAGKAEAEGRAPDRRMVMDLLKGFGRPAEAARRYHERPALIDPADTHHFLIWTIAGVVVLGVLSTLDREGSIDGGDVLGWLGLLTLFFAASAWWRRLRPNALGWRPNRGPDHMSRGLSLLSATMTLVFPVFMYAAPQTFVETMFLGFVANSGVALTPAFEGSPLRIATLGLLVATALIYGAMAVLGGERTWTRWSLILLSGGLAGLFMMHAAPMTAADGGTFEIFQSARANATARPILGGLGALHVLAFLYGLYREWARIRPAPSLAH